MSKNGRTRAFKIWLGLYRNKRCFLIVTGGWFSTGIGGGFHWNTHPNSRQLTGYRITSKNSVEHVHPQNEEMGKQLPDEYLHAFGNLVLLSPGQNSSYSNQTVRKKEADFVGKPVYDSLQLAHIFSVMKEKGNWDEAGIGMHEQKMLKLIRFHYTGVPPEGES